MNTKQPSKPASAGGNLIVVAAVFTAIAAFSVGSVMTAMHSYIRVNQRAHNYEKAFFLADAGLAAALVELNNDDGAGAISRTDSKSYFSGTNRFDGSDWGFTASLATIGNQKHITSTGSYMGATAVITVDAAKQGSGETIHALYAHAIYVGNSSGDTNYTLEIGGTGAGADCVNGDIYINGDISLTGDAFLRNPEAYTDSNGNGRWDEGEPWTECYGNGRYDLGEAFVDTIGNGVYDAGESYVDMGNGQYDAGEEYQDTNGNGVWDAGTADVWVPGGWGGGHWEAGTPAEPYSDEGNGVYDAGEPFTDSANGVYDVGETFTDNMNGTYDYGTQATGDIEGMPAPGAGQILADGGDDAVDPPNLANMYYNLPNTGAAPTNSSPGWGHDIAVADAIYNSSGKVTDTNNPCHIFMKNPSSGTGGYTPIPGKDDYFLQDPTDSTYGNGSQQISVMNNGNNKVYYVDGNLYIHSSSAYDFKFRNPGTHITIVARGNITISDEFRYNGGTTNPADTLCLIAMKDPSQTNSGNILLGDASYGTGGDVHAMLYAENDFRDNNLNTTGQSDLNIFGNMSAGNQVNLFRAGAKRTKLDVTLDRRIQDGAVTAPGVPPAQSGEHQQPIYVSQGWYLVKGSWQCQSRLK